LRIALGKKQEVKGVFLRNRQEVILHVSGRVARGGGHMLSARKLAHFSGCHLCWLHVYTHISTIEEKDFTPIWISRTNASELETTSKMGCLTPCMRRRRLNATNIHIGKGMGKMMP